MRTGSCGSGISGPTPRSLPRRSSSSIPTAAGHRWHPKAEHGLLERVAFALHACGEGLVVGGLLLRHPLLRLLFVRLLLLLLLRRGLLLRAAFRSAARDRTCRGASGGPRTGISSDRADDGTPGRAARGAGRSRSLARVGGLLLLLL